MSHITTIATKILSLDALEAAARELGGQLVRGKREQRSYQNGLTCDHVIAVPGCVYEVGVNKQPDGSYTLGFDAYGQGQKLVKAFGSGLQKLSQMYSVHAATIAARAKGYMVQRVAGKGGVIRLAVSGGGM